ncbi:MAG: hypothetical protein LBC77_08085 [Spirochaetaceae bacterium]|jgi:transglutaminase-like putative cysteine protease/Tfp pilus assembly protein PilF|nr:hypothetical protein [Spirochaetaceae bacterium]
MKPGLFSFDMTPYLNLHTEVSLDDELVYIIRTSKHDDEHIFMRRFVLSAYNSVKTGEREAGFTREERRDEKTQRAELPSGALELNYGEYKKREAFDQEYYIKNIDGAAFLAMNDPVLVTPYENYDVSSFKSVYSVMSMVSHAKAEELFASALMFIDDPNFGMSAEDYAWYTAFATAETGITETERKIKTLAEEITANYYDVFSKTVALLKYLREDGGFRYSLKPGIARDGDQLARFLFESKRGYCAYFALAYASMLRSIGIPSRVAVGFYLDPETERLGFYPVRSSSAHAWVEVFFPEYGWIEFDPTTDNYAEDEIQSAPGGDPRDNFEQLMKEILENRDKLKAKQALREDDETTFAEAIEIAGRAARKFGFPLLAIIAGVTLLVLRFRYFIASALYENPRKKTTALWRHIILRLRLKGFRMEKNISEARWIESLPCARLLRPLYENVSCARYAPDYSAQDAARFAEDYRRFSSFCEKMSRAKKAARLLVIIVLCFASSRAYAEEEFKSSNSLYSAAEEAVYAEYWERAVALFTRGKKEYPDDWRFPSSLGDLYFSKQLYQLAKEEYTGALTLIPDYPELIYKLAMTTGSLNEYDEAAVYFENYIEVIPEDWPVIAELGWVYFKLHRLEEGRDLLSSAIEKYGARPHLAMTLATIYSGLLDYNEARKFYLLAIHAALNMENGYNTYSFASTAYYNYAILESRFLNYETSFELARKSLEMADRDTGHMMRAELFVRRLEWQRAFEEYSKAFDMDKQSPLPKLSLAQVFLLTGRLEEARLYAEDCYKATNHAWMFRFGIDRAQYARDIHEILYKTYKGLYHKETLRAAGTIKDSAGKLVKRIQWYGLYIMHKKLFEKNALKTAMSYNIHRTGGEYLDALTHYYTAFSPYPSRALYYLDLAEEYETALIPSSAPGYLYERGKLKNNAGLIEEALLRFDPVWERDLSLAALSDYAVIAAKQRRLAKAMQSAEDLFVLNPGALPQNGIRLPVTLDISGGTPAQRKKLGGALFAAGFRERREKEGAGRFRLSVTLDGGTARYSFSGAVSGSRTAQGGAEYVHFDSEFCAAFANMAAGLIFQTR